VALLADPDPERLVERSAANPGRRRAHTGGRARKPHGELALVPRRGADRKRLAGPAVHELERARLRRVEAHGALRLRLRRELERHLGNQAERAERAGNEARHVVAGDVLHHLAAEAERLAAAVDQLYAEHEIAQRAGAGAPRAGQAGRDAAADRGPGAEVGRLEGETLAVRLEPFFQFRKRSAAASRHHQLGRLIRDDAAIAASIEDLAAQRIAVEVLGAAAAQAQRPMARGGLADAVGKRLDQKRGSSGCGS